MIRSRHIPRVRQEADVRAHDWMRHDAMLAIPTPSVGSQTLGPYASNDSSEFPVGGHWTGRIGGGLIQNTRVPAASWC